jgi:hypothetical protein
MPPLRGTRLPYGLHIGRTGHNPLRGPSAGWWVLTTANADGTHDFTCRSMEKLQIKIFGHPSNVTPKLLNFRDRMPKRTDRGAISPYQHLIRLIELEVNELMYRAGTEGGRT